MQYFFDSLASLLHKLFSIFNVFLLLIAVVVKSEADEDDSVPVAVSWPTDDYAVMRAAYCK